MQAIHSTVSGDGDFPLAGLPGSALDRLFEQLRDVVNVSRSEVEDLYQLSALQRAHLFSTINNAESKSQIEHLGFTLRGPLDVEAFVGACEQVVHRHPVLRSLYVWRELPAPIQVVLRHRPVRVEQHDWTHEHPETIPRRIDDLMRAQCRATSDPSAECPSRFTLITTAPEEFRLLLSFHRVLMDAWSGSIVIDEVFTIYEAERDRRTVTLPPAVPYRDYISWLKRQDRTAEEDYWRRQLTGFAAPTVLTSGASAGESELPGVDRVHLDLPALLSDQVTKLSQRCGGTASLVLHAAWALLLSRKTGATDVMFATTVTGRGADIPGVDRMVGPLINTVPTRVTVSPDQSVTEFLRARRDAQLELRGHEHASVAETRRYVDVPTGTRLFDSLFKYGTFAGCDKQIADLVREYSRESSEAVEQIDYPLVIEVNNHHVISLTATYHRSRLDEDTCAQLLVDYRNLIRDVVGHPEALLGNLPLSDAADSVGPTGSRPPQQVEAPRNDRSMTWDDVGTPAVEGADHSMTRESAAWQISGPAAFPLSGLTQESLDQIGCGADSDAVEDVYRLSPLQAGMLVESLSAAETDPYLRQWVFDLDGPLDVSAFCRAWQSVLDRHPGLRTHFAWEGLPHPVQVVSRRFLLVMERKDCRSIPESERSRWFERLLADEWGQGVALDTAPPLRLVLVRTAEDGHRLVWTCHHLLIDGWSRELVLSEVMTSYDALVSTGNLPPLPPPVPVRAFIALMDRVSDGAADYWAAQFEGFTGPTPLPAPSGIGPTGDMGLVNHPLSAESVTALRATARRYGVTAATVAQAAWALFLAAHSGATDVTFGVTVAGRSAALPGVERIVGMLISTVPERTIVNPSQRVGEWLRHIQDRRVAREPYEHHALTDISRWAKVPSARGIFDTRFVFHGFAEAPRSSHGRLTITEITELEGVIEYPLVLAVEVDAEPVAQLRFDRGYYDDQTARTLTLEYLAVLDDLSAATMNTSLGELISLAGAHHNGRSPRPESTHASEATETEAQRISACAEARTEAESTLAAIWMEILQIDNVDIHDDFFELGGDSILIFRAVALARQAGLPLTVRQALRQRTIAELATAPVGLAEHAPSTGQEAEPNDDIPLTPVLRRFTEQDIDHHHHNQSMLLSWYRPPDPDLLDRALQAVVAHHDALRFRLSSAGGGWRLRVGDAEEAGILRVVDLSDVVAVDRDEVMRHATDEANKGMDLTRGPLIRAVLFLDPTRVRLLVAVHHVAVDTVSWSILLDDLAAAYRQLEADQTVDLPATGTSYRHWADKLQKYTTTAVFEEESAYWLVPRPAAPDLPVDRPNATNSQATERTFETTLSADATQALVRNAPTALGCDVEEAMLSAVAYALSRWIGTDDVTMDIERHGREPLFDDLDLTRTIGWFTAVHRFHLHLPASGGPARRIRVVRDQLHAVPHHGLSYGLARYLRKDTAAALADIPGAQVLFAHHGQRSSKPYRGALFEATPEAPGMLRGPDNLRAYLIAVNTAVVDGRALVSWAYSAALHDDQTITRLAALCIDEMEALAGLCHAELSRGSPETRRHSVPTRLLDRVYPNAPAIITPMARHRAPGVGIALIANGELVSAWGEGITGGEQCVPVDRSTLFQACSVSKYVTALAVMHLVQEDRLGLDHDINRYLRSWRPPSAKNGEAPITLRGLLSHRAGLSVFRHPGYRRGSRIPTLTQILDGVAPANTPSIRRERPAGCGCHYSGANYSVIQQIIADVTGQPFVHAMRSLVFDPLGMTDSRYEQTSQGALPRAHGHLSDGTPYSGGWRVNPELASSGLWSTPRDLAKVSLEIYRAATGRQAVFLTQEIATQMITPVDAGYGLGVTTMRDGDTYWFGHPGDNHFFECLTATDLRSGIGFVIMTNIGGDSPFIADVLNELGVPLRYVIK